MRRYADWGRTKEWIYFDETYPENEIYLESGCPKYAMTQLIDQGFRLFICQGVDTAKLRKELEWEKSDEKDTELIRELFRRAPEKFVEFEKPQQLVFKRNLIMSEYEAITKELVGIKNRKSAIVKEFGPNLTYEESIKLFEQAKQKLLKQVTPLIQEEMSKIAHIKGVGVAMVARILAVAHPNKFTSKSAYLTYCGYTKDTRDSNKYNRLIKSLYYLAASFTMMHKDPVYRKMYDDVKTEQLRKTCATCWLTIKNHKCKKRKSIDQQICPIRAHTVALNRVSTQIAIEFYKKLHDVNINIAEELFNPVNLVDSILEIADEKTDKILDARGIFQ